MPQDSSFPPFSRRSFLSMSAAASATAAFGIVTEPMLAWAEQKPPFSKDAVMINSNENPLGPSRAALEAMSAILPTGGRYQWELTASLEKTFAEMQGVKPDYVVSFPGSSGPLHYTVLAYTSPSKSYVTADPGYEAGMHAAKVSGARVVKVGLTKTNAHDVKAMLAAAPDAGVFYICTPNNPTGTLTPHSDIEYLLANKPKGSIVLVDEAYIHFSDASSAIDLVKADKDVILLRTFSKIYGMAGLRCGFAIGRPDLLSRISQLHGWNAMPVTAVVAAVASLKDSALVSERKQINASVRQETFEWLDRNRYSYIPSVANFFLLDTGRPAKYTIDAMAHQDVFIGRNWPVMPSYVRVTVGTRPEMEKFQAAFKKVMDGTAVGRLTPPRVVPETLDGLMVRG
ncbi:MAG: pyridoxal phosphate-dependent aminotransferase [Terriglobales bacterium]